MSPKYLVAAALVATLGTPAFGQSVKAGIEAWQRADYATAVTIWRPLAVRGDADAEFNLGQAYRLGRGVPLDLSAAESWFQRAANSGHLDAEATLGLLLFQNGEKVDGIKWLRRAADQNEPRAQLVYGTALYNGDGVAQDRLLGYAYVSRAAGQGLAPAQETLAQLDGMLPPTDRRLALSIAADAQRAPRSSSAPKPQKPVKVASAQPSKAQRIKPVPIKQPAKPTAAPVAAVSGHWRIQLGAFSQRGAAEALYHRISGKAAVAGRVPFYVSAGPVTRLQVGPFPTKGAAASACSSLGIACFAIPAG
jgi:cell division septation protein DedD